MENLLEEENSRSDLSVKNKLAKLNKEIGWSEEHSEKRKTASAKGGTIKHTNICVIGVSERKEQEKMFKEMKTEELPSVI